MKKVFVKSLSNCGMEATTKFELLHFEDDSRDAIRISVKTKIPKREIKTYIREGYHIMDDCGYKDFCIKKSTLLKGLKKIDQPRKL